jgi:hypothetical protein
VIAGKVPLTEESRIATPSLVVPADTEVIAGCAKAGRVKLEKVKMNGNPAEKVQPPCLKSICKTCSLAIVGTHMKSELA